MAAIINDTLEKKGKVDDARGKEKSKVLSSEDAEEYLHDSAKNAIPDTAQTPSPADAGEPLPVIANLPLPSTAQIPLREASVEAAPAQLPEHSELPIPEATINARDTPQQLRVTAKPEPETHGCDTHPNANTGVHMTDYSAMAAALPLAQGSVAVNTSDQDPSNTLLTGTPTLDVTMTDSAAILPGQDFTSLYAHTAPVGVPLTSGSLDPSLPDLATRMNSDVKIEALAAGILTSAGALTTVPQAPMAVPTMMQSAAIPGPVITPTLMGTTAPMMTAAVPPASATVPVMAAPLSQTQAILPPTTVTPAAVATATPTIKKEEAKQEPQLPASRNRSHP